MLKLNPLTKKISKHFSLHPSRQKTLASMIFGAISSSNVHHQSLARYVDSPNPNAALRKVERFFVKKNCLPRITLKPLLNFWGLKESSTSALTDLIGNMAIRRSII
jgi:hypothetical protein